MENNPNPIILLDLNFTLVENSPALGAPFKPDYPVEREVYRQWLVKLCSRYHTEMITARPKIHRERTIANMIKLCGGWLPQGDHFNEVAFLKAPDWKERVLHERIFPKFGNDPSRFIALESNQETRAMYERHGIYAVPVPKVVGWVDLPRRP